MINVIVLAAGLGSRISMFLEKQYLWINGLPLFCYSLKFFDDLDNIETIYVAVPKSHIDMCKKLVLNFLKGNHRIVFYAGGKNRQDSVYRGLKIVKKAVGFILIHDAARPFLSYELFNRCLEGSKKNGVSIPVIPVTDSLVKIINFSKFSSSRINRDYMWMVQTPQIFDFDLLFSSYLLNKGNYIKFTDDSSILKITGSNMNFVCGCFFNFKITTKYDLKMFEFLLDYFKVF